MSTVNDKVFKTLHILPESHVKDLYESHSSYNEGDAGLDLFIPNDITVSCNDTVIVDLCVKCEMVETDIETGIERFLSYYVYPRSSIYKTPFILANSVGVIDKGYRGSLKVILKYIPRMEDIVYYNTHRVFPTYTIKRGERLTQLCLPSLEPFSFELVDSLSETERGEGGLGSTGK
jgi:dUTP pyrophosphatase